jgi:hypothetical protein
LRAREQTLIQKIAKDFSFAIRLGVLFGAFRFYPLFHVAVVACFAIDFLRLISFFSFRVELSAVKPLAEKSLLLAKEVTVCGFRLNLQCRRVA